MQRTRDLVRSTKAFLPDELDCLGLLVQNGEGCYLIVRLPSSDTLAYLKFMRQGVMVRTMTGFRFSNWVMVSIGRPQAMEACID